MCFALAAWSAIVHEQTALESKNGTLKPLEKQSIILLSSFHLLSIFLWEKKERWNMGTIQLNEPTSPVFLFCCHTAEHEDAGLKTSIAPYHYLIHISLSGFKVCCDILRYPFDYWRLNSWTVLSINSFHLMKKLQFREFIHLNPWSSTVLNSFFFFKTFKLSKQIFLDRIFHYCAAVCKAKGDENTECFWGVFSFCCTVGHAFWDNFL